MLANIMFSVSMVLLSIYIFIYSMDLGGTAAIFPKLTAIPFFIFSVISLILACSKDRVETNPAKLPRVKIKRFINFIIIMLSYTLVIELLGYYISSVLLFVMTALVLTDDNQRWKTKRSKLRLLATAIVTVAIIFLIFQVFLNVPLPALFKE